MGGRQSGEDAPTNPGQTDLAASVLRLLARQPAGACFVAELRTLLGGRPDEMETALTGLVLAGAVFLQHYYCPDPHFEGEDLRVVVLIDRSRTGDAGEEAAAAAAQRFWQRWLDSFLASHRCT